MQNEVWKDVIGYEGLYMVSNFGRVKSLSFNKTTGNVKLRKINIQNSGYFYLGLHKGGTAKNFLVHRLVAIAFLKNPNKYQFVNHKNGIKTDNRIANLEWCTKSYNLVHAFKNGLKKITEAHLVRLRKFNTETKSIPVSQYTLDGKFIAKYKSGVEAAQITGINYFALMSCVNGYNKTSGGFLWKQNKNLNH